MDTVRIGRTGIVAAKNGFGALPVQRVSMDESVYLLQKAFYNGVNFFDTARGYSDSEEKLGNAFSHVRSKLYIASKTPHFTVDGFWSDLEASLKMLKTDYIDIYQFHNPTFCPLPGDGTGLYECMLEAKKQGKIRFIGISNHRVPVAMQAVESGLYDSVQFPFSYLASDNDIALVKAAKAADVGFIAMKGMSGGLITNSAAAYAFMSQFDNVLPIWGVQREKELDEWLSYFAAPPKLDDAMRELIAHDKKELSGNFCRGCGYCMPCPVGIPINTAARLMLMIRRSPFKRFLTEEWQAQMELINKCLHCNKCKNHCPYGLDTPELLKSNYNEYKVFLAENLSKLAE